MATNTRLTYGSRKLEQKHVPTRGNRTEVYIARLADGQTSDPVFQTLVTGFMGTVTINAAAAGVYALTIAGVVHSYTAVSSNNKKTILDSLMAAVNAGTTAVAVFPDYTANTFRVCKSATFTLTQTSPTTNAAMSVSAISGSTPPAKGDTQVALAIPLTGEIQVGQYLTFGDVNDIERLCKVTTKAVAGATTIEVEALPEAIAAGSVAEYPPYLWDRTGANLTRNYTIQTTTTFNTSGNRDGTPTGKEKNISLPGLYNYYNGAYQTALQAAEDEAFIWVKRQSPPPNDSFVRGSSTYGRALVANANDTSSQDSYVQADLEIQFMGSITESPPVAA